MDLDELRSVRRTERGKDSLQHLRDSFYEDVAAYIAERKAERRRIADAADDPFGNPEVGQLTDEINTAEDVVEAIYERRVGKVVKLASFAAADMSADKTGLTAEERTLFDDLVDRITRNRRTVLDTLVGEEDVAADAEPDTATDTEPDTATDNEPDTATDNEPDTVTDATARAPEEPPAHPDPQSDGAESISPSAVPSDSADSAPPTPDDVLAAAMGGGDAEAGEESVPPSVGSDTDDSDRDVAVADTAETDGGDVALAAGSAASGPSADGDSESRRPRTPDTGTAAGTAGPAPEADASDADRVTLRITADVGRIYGIDEREYDLAAEDVVTLPATNAGPLVERDAAERLE